MRCVNHTSRVVELHLQRRLSITSFGSLKCVQKKYSASTKIQVIVSSSGLSYDVNSLRQTINICISAIVTCSLIALPRGLPATNAIIIIDSYKYVQIHFSTNEWHTASTGPN